MNRYKSSQKWRKVRAGVYESPGRLYCAEKQNGGWVLHQLAADGWVAKGRYLTLADCQEYVEKLKARGASV